MDFVDRHRRINRMVTPPLRQPVLIAPLVPRQIPNHGGALRPYLTREGVRIRLVLPMPVDVRGNRVLIESPLVHPGDETLPDAAVTATP